MKKKLLIIAPLLVAGIVLFFIGGLPIRFKLESTSPSGKSHVTGLRFEGKNTHALDGTLRLFVFVNKKESRLHTSIPFERDLAIKWKENSQNEAFAIEKKGHAIIEFEINGSDLKCTKGVENLVDDPFKTATQDTPPNDR